MTIQCLSSEEAFVKVLPSHFADLGLMEQVALGVLFDANFLSTLDIPIKSFVFFSITKKQEI